MTQPFHQQQEIVFYQNHLPIFISSNKALFLNQSFILTSIGSVSIKKVKPPRRSVLGMALIGLVLILVACFWPGYNKLSPESILGLTVVFLFGTGLLVVGLFKYFSSAPKYALVIGTPTGQSKVIVSPDYNYILTLKNTLIQALNYNNRN